MKKSSSILKKNLISSLVFILFVTIAFYFIFRENDIKEIIVIIKNSKQIYLLIAVFCMALFSIFEASNLKILLKLIGNKINFRNAYKYALSGFFTASITPSSSGGDPMQFYLMTKDKIPVSHSAITLLTKLLVFQLVSILISLFCFFTSYNFFNNSLGNIKFLIYLGIFLNFIVFTLYFLVIFFKPVIVSLTNLLCKVLNKFNYKKTSIVKEKIDNLVNEYQRAGNTLKENKKVFIKVVLLTILQMLSYYSIPYFVYLALGFSEYSILTFISIQSVLFISVSSLPFPGAVGISELTFMRLYNHLYAKNILGSAMVITRFINFYIFVLYSGIMMLILILKDNLYKK